MKSSSLICQSVLFFFTQMKGICSLAAVLVRGRNSKHQKQYDKSQSLGLKVYFFIRKCLEPPSCQCSNLKEIENRYLILKDHHNNRLQS